MTSEICMGTNVVSEKLFGRSLTIHVNNLKGSVNYLKNSWKNPKLLNTSSFYIPWNVDLSYLGKMLRASTSISCFLINPGKDPGLQQQTYHWWPMHSVAVKIKSQLWPEKHFGKDCLEKVTLKRIIYIQQRPNPEIPSVLGFLLGGIIVNSLLFRPVKLGFSYIFK